VDATRDVQTATASAEGVVTTSVPDDRRGQLDAGRLLQPQLDDVACKRPPRAGGL
jgi:hypothetical protein